MEVGSLYVIMKIVERCNLKCSYCYYYTPDNKEVLERDQVMSAERLGEVVDYVERATTEHSIRQVVFGFHGGEPTLAKVDRIRDFCAAARTRLAGKTKVAFALQTNGVHLSDGWLGLIAQEGMGVGISIDGEKAVHDRYRIDHRGRGSYDRVRANLEKLLQVERDVARTRVTALAVMSPDFTGADAYDHLVETLGIRHVKLLFEDRTADDPIAPEERHSLLQRLCDVFDRWLVRDARKVTVIPFDRLVRGVVRKKFGKAVDTYAPTLGFAVLSDGRVRIQDDFMVARDWFWSQATVSAAASSFEDYVMQPHLRELVRNLKAPPPPCRDCKYALVCRGGEVAHRYKKENGFDNRSVYCDVLFGLCRHIEQRLFAASEGTDSTVSPGTVTETVAVA
jgi:uncharacterized protein